VKQYRKAIEIKPDMAVSHKNLRVALFAMGRIDEGIASYKRAFILNPAILRSTPSVSSTAPGIKPAMQYYYFAKVSAASGKVDEALGCLTVLGGCVPNGTRQVGILSRRILRRKVGPGLCPKTVKHPKPLST